LRKLKAQTLIISFLALLHFGCDPGYRLKPVGWQATSAQTWVKEFEDFNLETRGIGGLIGESWVSPDLQIYHSTKPISVESAELRTDKETFQAKIYGDSPIPPQNNNYHIPVSWDFENKRFAREVLGNHCEIILNLKVGLEKRQIRIEYEREY